MHIQKCTIADVPTLAKLNKQLIDDEKSNNFMSISELENRMREFLKTDYVAYFFIKNSKIIGYALLKATVEPVYLRQFLIDREYREQHYGKQVFQMLMQHLEIDKIDIEILPWNQIGYSFWKSCGFKELSISMRYEI